MSAQPNLQAEIALLAAWPILPESAWVARVKSSPVEVIAGAMLIWVPHAGISAAAVDQMAPRREAAQAILDARLSEQTLNATAQLRNTIDDYQRKSERQSTIMLSLTIMIAVLTATQIWIALR